MPKFQVSIRVQGQLVSQIIEAATKRDPELIGEAEHGKSNMYRVDQVYGPNLRRIGRLNELDWKFIRSHGM